jgi:hypothetical protein
MEELDKRIPVKPPKVKRKIKPLTQRRETDEVSDLVP